jgi:RHS repeat-associated protein
MRLYVDGVLDGAATNSGPAAGNSGVRLGRNEQNGSYFFNGLIDEVRVSNTAVYSSNFTPQTHLTSSGSTAALWKFDGQTTNDSSTNGNNGTLQGGATYSDDVPSGDGGGGGGSGTSSKVQWLIMDHLGTPRMVLDQTGALNKMTRHDYLPFGEELFDPTGGRNAAQGYSSDNVRQRFTQKERDVETGLDFFEARYYASMQGRFTSIDPYNIVMERQFATNARKAESQFTVYLSNPQRWTRYTYALNNPLLYTDPHGEDVTIYYRPPREGAGISEDQGHILIYVRNDETGESAYYDYIATGDYNNFGTTQLNGVTQERIDAHASITIGTNASQEQAVLDGIKAAQQSSPDYSLSATQALRHTETTCTSQVIKLLALGGINVGPSILPQSPTAVWQSAFEQYGNKDANRATVPAPQPRFPHRTREIINGYDNPPRVDPGREYGRDPRGQARVLDRNATNNYTIKFRGGQRVP